MPKLVLFRGPMCAGKSTAFANLVKSKKLKKWIFVSFPALKQMFGEVGAKDRIKLGKKALFAVLKEAVKTKRNILTEEISEKAVRKRINSDLKKYKYGIMVFQFTCSGDESYKRIVKRGKLKGRTPTDRKEADRIYKAREKGFDPNGILIDTDKLSEKQVVSLIVNQLS